MKKEEVSNKLKNQLFEYYGKKKTIEEWATLFEIRPRVVYDRFLHGWCFACALETPMSWTQPVKCVHQNEKGA